MDHKIAALTRAYPYEQLTPEQGVEIAITQEARVPLPPEEADEQSRVMAENQIRLRELQDIRKDYMNKTAREIKRLEGVVDESARQAQIGALREVPHIEQHDTVNQQIRVYRMDTDPPQCVEVRKATPEELGQTDLFPENEEQPKGKGRGRGGGRKKKPEAEQASQAPEGANGAGPAQDDANPGEPPPLPESAIAQQGTDKVPKHPGEPNAE